MISFFIEFLLIYFLYFFDSELFLNQNIIIFLTMHRILKNFKEFNYAQKNEICINII